MQIISFLGTSLPLLLAAFGALISEYAGVMAVFIDGIINLCAFLTYAFTVFTGNIFAGCLCATLISTCFTTLTAFFTQKTKANPFITGLSVNLFSSGIISLLSSMWFNTKGNIYGSSLFTSVTSQAARTYAVIPCLLLIFIITFALYRTKWGLRIRITGSALHILRARGVNSTFYKISAWTAAGLLASFSGILCTLRLSSFVQNVSAGRGWIALVAVFLGRKSAFGTICAVLLITAAEFLINNIGLIKSGVQIPPTLLLAVPYAASLICFILFPAFNNSSPDE